jgi:hypothetical protein
VLRGKRNLDPTHPDQCSTFVILIRLGATGQFNRRASLRTSETAIRSMLLKKSATSHQNATIES